MRLIADECVARPVISALRKHFEDVIAIEEQAPGAQDVDVLAWANREQRILITEDYDFGDLVHLRQMAAYGIVIIAPGVFRGDLEGIADQIALRIAGVSDTLKGNLTIIEMQRIRQRPLSA